MARSEELRNHDKATGIRLRDRRLEAGLSQKQLAAKIRLTHQQIQKYESGANSLAISRAIQIAQALDIDPRDLMPPKNGDPVIVAAKGLRSQAELNFHRQYDAMPSHGRRAVWQHTAVTSKLLGEMR